VGFIRKGVFVVLLEKVAERPIGNAITQDIIMTEEHLHFLVQQKENIPSKLPNFVLIGITGISTPFS